MAEKLAIIRIRGNTGVKSVISDTMTMLNLPNQHNCVIVEATPTIKGMIKKAQHFITYGPVSEEAEKELAEKRTIHGKTYRLSPPVKGFERKGIKVPFKLGGALGDRGVAINDLIKRMV